MITQTQTHQPIASNKLAVLCDLERHPKSTSLAKMIKIAWERATRYEAVNPCTWTDVMYKLNAVETALCAFHIDHVQDDLSFLHRIADQRWDMAKQQLELTEDPDINDHTFNADAWDYLANCRAYDSLLK